MSDICKNRLQSYCKKVELTNKFIIKKSGGCQVDVRWIQYIYKYGCQIER